MLILSTSNSATSIMAEALFNTMGHGMFKAYSAGSLPTGVISRFALEEIRKIGYPTGSLRSKSWNEFSQQGAPEMDIVITVCDNVAKKVLPTWHGKPVTAHWGFDEPTAVKGSFEEKKEAFRRVFLEIRNRIDLLSQLPLAHLDKISQKEAIEKIGQAVTS